MDYLEADKTKIFKCISGSHAYGTNVEGSDTDYRGIFISPAIYLLGLDVVEQVENTTKDDVLFELRKYVKLCAECNPNILELLFIDDQHILFKNRYFEKLRENRQLFLSKRVRHTYSGYAVAQLHRIRNHRGYILNPPSHKPTREEFGLKNETLIANEHKNALCSVPDDYVKDEIKEYILKEKQYKKELDKWNSYQEWDKKRNPYRKELEHKYKYDTKHAMHLVRLINMGEEILTTGNLTVFRPEREELKAIRNGEWSYEKIEEFAGTIDSKFAELEKKSTLPYTVNYKKIRELLVELLSEAYGIKFDLGINV